MCALITVFTVIISLFENLNILNFLAEKFCLNPKNFSCFAISCLEVTSATFFAAKNHAPFLIICLGVSYGGLCTHFQVASILFKISNFQGYKRNLLPFSNHYFSQVFRANRSSFHFRPCSVYSFNILHNIRQHHAFSSMHLFHG